MLYYRIVDIDPKTGDYKSLFHGTQGSRVLKEKKWYVADKKMVTDGNKKTSTEYLSGFHVFDTLNKAKRFVLTNFKRLEDKAIVSCRVKNIKRKEHSRSDILLVDYIYIEELLWTYREEREEMEKLLKV